MANLINFIKNTWHNFWNLGKPGWASRQDWATWRKETQQKYPARWFLSRTLPAWRRRLINKVSNAYWWVRWRTFSRYNIIKIRSLKPGYYERDDRLLHGAFSILVDYVEEGLSGDPPSKFPWFWTTFWWLDFRNTRSPQRGLEGLLRDATFGYYNDPYYIYSQQAQVARDTRELYLWWKEVYPKRITSLRNDPEWKSKDSAAKSRAYKNYLDNLQSYRQEDEKQLIRLIKLREHLI